MVIRFTFILRSNTLLCFVAVVATASRWTDAWLSFVDIPKQRRQHSSTSRQVSMMATAPIKRIAEPIWRSAARQHQEVIWELLRPGLTSPEHPINSGQQRQQKKRVRSSQLQHSHEYNSNIHWTALDPQNPVFNFLIEYYGIKGTKGSKRLARWSPGWHSHSATVYLEGAQEEDLASILHLRGASIEEADGGILYCPRQYFHEHRAASTSDPESTRTKLIPTIAAYLWYRAVLQQTLSAEPVLYCHGLHEWAMQYHPAGAPPPPSAQYQMHLPLRVSQAAINAAVERVGTRCTHVDALRYFAPAAAPWNHHGASLERMDQLRLEQPACVHAHMDLLKMALKLQPFIDATLIQRVLQMALVARRLDIAASPYDATAYGVEAVPVETEEGRLQYRQQQIQLMKEAEPIRRDLLQAYDDFLQYAFAPDLLEKALNSPANERFAKAEPGGLPWRKNLVQG
jgi:hypothetical protein